MTTTEPTARDRRVTALRKVLEEALRNDPENGSAAVGPLFPIDDGDIHRAAGAALTHLDDPVAVMAAVVTSTRDELARVREQRDRALDFAGAVVDDLDEHDCPDLPDRRAQLGRLRRAAGVTG